MGGKEDAQGPKRPAKRRRIDDSSSAPDPEVAAAKKRSKVLDDLRGDATVEALPATATWASFSGSLKTAVDEAVENLRVGSFSYGAAVEMPHPILHVAGVGHVGFPIHPAVAELLLAQGTAAPFGRKEETLWDPKVRNAIQIDPSKISFHDAALWSDFIERQVAVVKSKLSISPGATVEAELYKMVIYAKGGHFAAHRDTEKSPGMFATMVVVLPADFKGGALVVEHKKEEATYQPASMRAGPSQ
eukprot:g20814.t1